MDKRERERGSKEGEALGGFQSHAFFFIFIPRPALRFREPRPRPTAPPSLDRRPSSSQWAATRREIGKGRPAGRVAGRAPKPRGRDGASGS